MKSVIALLMSDGERAKSRTPIPSGVPVAYLAWLSMLLRSLGRFPWWGSFMLLGTKVPWGVSPEEGGTAHGRDVQVPGDVHGSSCWIFCIGFGLIFCLFVLGYSSLGWILVWPFSPSKLDPCRYLFGSFSLSFCLVCSPATFFSLFLSFFFLSLSLRRWGNPNPLGVWVSLVTLLRAHGLRPRPVLPLPLIHQGPAPAPVFFCFSPSFAWVVVGC